MDLPGTAGVVSLFAGAIVSFVAGALVAFLFGYTDAISITTIGAGAATYIVGPVTGTAIAIAISVAVVKTPSAGLSIPAWTSGIRRALP